VPLQQLVIAEIANEFLGRDTSALLKATESKSRWHGLLGPQAKLIAYPDNLRFFVPTR